MRRTLTVLVASAALLVPATAASASTNASCNSGSQRGPADTFGTDGYNDKGNYDFAFAACSSTSDSTGGTVVGYS